ncbi:hypothetical protein THTE_0267 [Thermogutta terrifontis]|uniref:Uncharacterized protein n=1 Tax=Thermogutta terrifontis TaxID=1331910 RepID=A0A286RA89_9BACT|nr:hypothetical protein THTE_0267 [Thermogutta terrifontis]
MDVGRTRQAGPSEKLFGGARLSCPVTGEWIIDRCSLDLTSRSLRNFFGPEKRT